MHTFYQDLFLQDLKQDLKQAREEAASHKSARMASEAQAERLRKQTQELKASVQKYRDMVAQLHQDKRRLEGSLFSDSEGSEESFGDKQIL